MREASRDENLEISGLPADFSAALLQCFQMDFVNNSIHPFNSLQLGDFTFVIVPLGSCFFSSHMEIIFHKVVVRINGMMYVGVCVSYCYH